MGRISKDYSSLVSEIAGTSYLVDYEIGLPSKGNLNVTCLRHNTHYIQRLDQFLSGSHTCKVCKTESSIIPFHIKVCEANKIHDNKYEYDETNYRGVKSKTTIICPTCGPFRQSFYKHIDCGQGCPRCCERNPYKGRCEEYENKFISDALAIHGDRYDYSMVKYVRSRDKVKIVCPEHGVFEISPNNHISKVHGCNICAASSGEKIIHNYLNEKGITYYNEVWFSDCRYINPLPFDFHLPNQNLLIEFHGGQHYFPVSLFGGVSSYETTKIRDKIKWDYSQNENNPNLLIIPYWDIKDIPKILNEVLMMEETTYNPNYSRLPISK